MCVQSVNGGNCGGVKYALCIRWNVRCFCESRAFLRDIQKRWTDANRKDDAGQIPLVRNKNSLVPDFLYSLPRFMPVCETTASTSFSRYRYFFSTRRSHEESKCSREFKKITTPLFCTKTSR